MHTDVDRILDLGGLEEAPERRKMVRRRCTHDGELERRWERRVSAGRVRPKQVSRRVISVMSLDSLRHVASPSAPSMATRVATESPNKLQFGPLRACVARGTRT